MNPMQPRGAGYPRQASFVTAGRLLCIALAAGLMMPAAGASDLEHWQDLCAQPRAEYWNRLCAARQEPPPPAAADSLAHWRNLCGQPRAEYWNQLCRQQARADSQVDSVNLATRDRAP